MRKELARLLNSVFYTDNEFDFKGYHFWSQEDEGDWHIFTEVEEELIPFCYYDVCSGERRTAEDIADIIIESLF